MTPDAMVPRPDLRLLRQGTPLAAAAPPPDHPPSCARLREFDEDFDPLGARPQAAVAGPPAVRCAVQRENVAEDDEDEDVTRSPQHLRSRTAAGAGQVDPPPGSAWPTSLVRRAAGYPSPSARPLSAFIYGSSRPRADHRRALESRCCCDADTGRCRPTAGCRPRLLVRLAGGCGDRRNVRHWSGSQSADQRRAGRRTQADLRGARWQVYG